MEQNQNPLASLYEVVLSRQENPQEGSYTCYLFEQGIDKILKKCGEENAEMLIAAKNGDSVELANEICDLLYHMTVLMAQCKLPMSEVNAILEERAKKIGNLKTFHKTDKDT